MRVLVVKLSSLGDVVHTLPAITDAASAIGEVSFDWVVEEAFATIARLHPAVETVREIAIRRWRRAPAASVAEILRFRRTLRERHYDLVVDAQGLIKSAVVAATAYGRRVGYDKDSVREKPARWAYHEQIAVPRNLHAIERTRRLFAGALGYQYPPYAADFGLEGVSTDRAQRRLLLLPGTTWPSKRWPLEFWTTLARRAVDDGMDVVIAWGSPQERADAQVIVTASGARLSEPTSLFELVSLMRASTLVVGADGGPTHLAAAVGTPALGLFGATNPRLTGLVGNNAHSLEVSFPCAPCLNKHCTYSGPRKGIAVEPPCFASLPPELVWEQCVAMMSG